MKKRSIADQESRKILQEQKDTLQKVESYPYSEYLRAVMNTSVYTCTEDAMLRDVLQGMISRKISSAIVVDKGRKPVGILTERDIMQRVVSKECADISLTPITSVMTPDPVVLRPHNSIYRALSVLSTKGIKHLPLVENDKIAGIVTMRQLLKLRYPEPMTLIEGIWEATDAAALRRVRDKLPAIADSRLQSGRKAHDIVVMISLVNRDIHRKILEMSIKEMGEPPAPISVYLTGSHGRLENLLVTDQDHGMIIADNDNESQYDEYYIELTSKFSARLAEADFELCSGYIMSSNPLWRKSVSEWKQQIRYWFEKQVRELGRFSTVLFDASHVYGARALFRDVRDFAFSQISMHRDVLQVMHEEEGGHKVPLGLLGRFITEKDQMHRGEIAIKRSGLLFVVEGVRILALMHGIKDTATLKRLEALVKGGFIHPDDGEYFESAYLFLLQLALETEVKKIMNNKPVDTYIKPENLSKLDRETLRHAYKAVSSLQELVASEFGELVI